MPNLMDILNGLGSPAVPKRAISGLQNAISPGSDAPLPQAEPNMLLDMLGLNHPWGEVGDALGDLSGLSLGDVPEAIGGFASGAMEGARNMTSPANIAAMLPAMGALKGVNKIAPRVAKVAGPTLDILEDIPVRQVNPGMGEARDLMWELQQNMDRVPNATGQMRRPGQNAMQGLQSAAPQAPRAPQMPQMPPEFVPRGGEGAFNAARPHTNDMAINLPPNNAQFGNPRVPVPPPSASQMNRGGYGRR